MQIELYQISILIIILRYRLAGVLPFPCVVSVACNLLVFLVWQPTGVGDLNLFYSRREGLLLWLAMGDASGRLFFYIKCYIVGNFDLPVM